MQYGFDDVHGFLLGCGAPPRGFRSIGAIRRSTTAARSERGYIFRPAAGFPYLWRSAGHEAIAFHDRRGVCPPASKHSTGPFHRSPSPANSSAFLPIEARTGQARLTENKT
jgi:hypothetical protein